MSNTLAELSTLATDKMAKGILDTIIYESPLMRRVPFETVNSNNVLYNLEQTLVGGNWVTTGDTITESTAKWAQRTAKLYELIGDADVDNFVRQTRGDQDIEAAIIQKKVKGMIYDWEKAALYGGTTASGQFASAKCMTGLLLMLAQCEEATGAATDLDGINNTQVIPASATSGVLTLTMLDQLVDAIKPGKPDVLIMSKRLRRKLNALLQAAGTNLEHDKNQAGFMVERWGSIEIITSDFIYDNIQDGSSSVLDIINYNPSTTRAAGNDNSIILAMQFGANQDGVCGLKNGDLPDLKDHWDKLESKNASRQRIKMYTGMANYMPTKLAGLINVQDVAL